MARRGGVANETRVDVGRAFRVNRAVLVRVDQTRKHAGSHGRVIIGRRLAELLLLPDQLVQVAVVCGADGRVLMSACCSLLI